MAMHFREREEKITYSMIIAGIIIIGLLMTSLIVFLSNYGKTEQKGNYAKGKTDVEDINSFDDFEDVSMEIGKKVEETKNELNSNSTSQKVNDTDAQNIINKKNIENTTSEQSKTKETAVNFETQENNTSNNTVESKDKEEEQKEIKFIEPIKGEILREFAPDSLVYSNTLEEWVTHNGIDIKADKTSVVVSAADGIVSSIKNDPRYGLTVIIDHPNGFQTIYANLLTAEFVVEGEEVKQEQTIGTVGNSAAFEIADDYHLHFEMLKDGEHIDPESYIK